MAIEAKITSIAQLEAIYGTPGETSTVKVANCITPQYHALIEASPFVALATVGPEGLDCSPRGENGCVVAIENDKTLLMPDRRGNNRIDSLRNIVRDPRVGLLFLLPGAGSTVRLNGRAVVSVEPRLLDQFVVAGKAPRSVIVITVEEVYFQCARAIVRSDLWNPARFVDSRKLPTPGNILETMSEERVGGVQYDEEWPERARKSLW